MQSHHGPHRPPPDPTTNQPHNQYRRDSEPNPTVLSIDSCTWNNRRDTRRNRTLRHQRSHSFYRRSLNARLFHRNLPNKPVSPPGNRLNKLPVVRVFIQRPPQRRNSHRKVRFLHKRLRPHRIHHLGLGHQLTMPPHQHQQGIEAPRRQGDLLAIAGQQTVHLIQPKVTESVDDGRSLDGSPNEFFWRACEQGPSHGKQHQHPTPTPQQPAKPHIWRALQSSENLNNFHPWHLGRIHPTVSIFITDQYLRRPR